MKRLLLIFGLILMVNSCKNQSSTEVNLKDNRSKQYSADDGLITLKGEYVLYTDVAVLQTKTEIYGVVIDDNLYQLEAQVKPLKKEATDMVPVTVRVRKFEKPKGEEGWKYRVEIKDILKVEAPDELNEDVITITK